MVTVMSIRLPKRRTALITLAALIVAYLLFGWLALPPLLQWQAQKFITERTGHRLSMDKPGFNPFKLALRLHNLQLQEPDGKPLLAFKELLVDVSAESLFRWAYVFDAIRLEGLEATLTELPGERLNWSALLDALKDPQEKPQPSFGLPRLIVHSIVLADGRLDLADRRAEPGLATRVEPLSLELEDLSTLRDDKGPYELSARTGFGARIQWQGSVGINPLTVAGNFTIDDVSLARLPPALIRLPAGLAPPEGMATLAANYQLTQSNGAIEFTLDQFVARLTGLLLKNDNDAGPLLAVDTVEAKDGRFDLRKRSMVIGSVALTGGGISLHRDAQGRLNLPVLQPGPAAPPAATASAVAPAAPAGPAWHYRIEHLGVDGFAATFRDLGLSPAAEFALQDIAISVDGFNEDLKTPLPVRVSFRARDGGDLSAEGKVVVDEPSAELQVKLTDLAMKPLQPYLGAATTLKLADGRLSADGRANYDAKGAAAYRGGLAVRALRLTEADSGVVFAAWKSLATRSLDVTPARLNIGDLALDGLDTQLIIAKDKSVNVTRILRRPAADAAEPAPPPGPGKSAPAYPISIARLRLTGSQMEFADYSLALPFGTRIHDLHGTVNGISSRPGAPSQVELDGEVDDYGMARAAGQVDLFAPTDFMDLKVVFRNVEMAHLTPYSATFAGRKIESGKLSLDLEYKINKRQLSGENRVVMEQLTLGERVESPSAKDLPLDLAIALLQDADGRIDLGLPVSGSLDDPQFSYGQLVWKVIVNVLTKIVTAPFRALGALFGGAEHLDSIAFEAGQPQLTPPEREKLTRLAAALQKRPGLALAIHGAYAETDRVAMQDLQLRRAVAAKLGLPVDDKDGRGGDPGPISTGQAKVQSVLESLLSDRFGGGELAALKEGFRKANPGQMEEGGAGKMMSRLTGVFREKRTLTDTEVAQMKNADFHALLYERLRAKEAVPEEKLQALARTRGDGALALLKAADAPAERVSLLDPVKVETSGSDVPLKMELKAAARTGAAPATPPVPAPAAQ